MGALQHLDIGPWISRYQTTIFVETGAGWGYGLRFAAQFPFQKLYSVEIMEGQARNLQQAFQADARIEVQIGRSNDFLTRLLPNLPAAPILFWLDAHYPGADLDMNPYDAETNLEVRLPLQGELELIRKLRPEGRDVIIVDDYRIYADGPFTGGGLRSGPLAHLAAEGEATWISELFERTHTISASYEDTGYLFLFPHCIPYN